MNLRERKYLKESQATNTARDILASIKNMIVYLEEGGPSTDQLYYKLLIPVATLINHMSGIVLWLNKHPEDAEKMKTAVKIVNNAVQKIISWRGGFRSGQNLKSIVKDREWEDE